MIWKKKNIKHKKMFNLSILKIKNKGRNPKFSCIFLNFLDNQTHSLPKTHNSLRNPWQATPHQIFLLFLEALWLKAHKFFMFFATLDLAVGFLGYSSACPLPH